jgi:hypothetical protein
MKAEFDIEHEGEVYWVEVEFETTRVDDSFDGHLAGRVHTFKGSHREPDMDTLEVVSCTDGLAYEVEPDEGMLKAIAAKVSELDI